MKSYAIHLFCSFRILDSTLRILSSHSICSQYATLVCQMRPLKLRLMSSSSMLLQLNPAQGTERVLLTVAAINELRLRISEVKLIQIFIGGKKVFIATAQTLETLVREVLGVRDRRIASVQFPPNQQLIGRHFGNRIIILNPRPGTFLENCADGWRIYATCYTTSLWQRWRKETVIPFLKMRGMRFLRLRQRNR